jgi:hypothetical protein
VVFDKQKEEVIEAVATGVRVTPLRVLLAQAHRLQIIRPPGWTPAAGGRRSIARARASAQKYDWLGLVGRAGRQAFYCTELAVDSYRGARPAGSWVRIIFPPTWRRSGTLTFDSGPRDQAQRAGARFARRLPGRARCRLRGRGRARPVPGRAGRTPRGSRGSSRWA